MRCYSRLCCFDDVVAAAAVVDVRCIVSDVFVSVVNRSDVLKSFYQSLVRRL